MLQGLPANYGLGLGDPENILQLRRGNVRFDGRENQIEIQASQKQGWPARIVSQLADYGCVWTKRFETVPPILTFQLYLAKCP